MLKQLIAGFLALGITVATLPVANTNRVTATSLEFDNILDLCLYVQSNGHWFNNANDCSIYTKDQTSVVMDYRNLEIDDPIVFKNLDITFTRPNNPFIFRNNGSLTINGGTYTSPNCVIWIQYDNSVEPARYVSTPITINAGTFVASVETEYSAEAPSPVCIIPYSYVTLEEAKTAIANFLPAGKRFVDVAPKLRSTKTNSVNDGLVPAESGYAHISKDGETRDEIKYLKTTTVTVVDVPAPEPTPEEPETPTEPESSTETPKTPVLPKAPNTGRGK